MNRQDVDISRHNRDAWNYQVDVGNRWTLPVSADQIEAARRGVPEVVLTPNKPVPDDWLAPLMDRRVLCLASGGGQQVPLLAAAGGRVTSMDISPRQLDQDRAVAEKFGLRVETVEADMTKPFPFSDSSFDLIFHPCSNGFVSDVRPTWLECGRVLAAEGVLLAGFSNPLRFLFEEEGQTPLVVCHRIPYSDLEQRSPDLLEKQLADNEPLAFGHSLTDQLGGQIAAGLSIDGFYEDRYLSGDALSERIAIFVATRASKLHSGKPLAPP